MYIQVEGDSTHKMREIQLKKNISVCFFFSVFSDIYFNHLIFFVYLYAAQNNIVNIQQKKLQQAHGAEAFRIQVIGEAMPWTDWYGDQILKEHGDFAADANAFRRCTDRLTGFISDLSIPSDQTFHVHRFAKALADGMWWRWA